MKPEPGKPVGTAHHEQTSPPAYSLWRAGLGRWFVGLAAITCLAMCLLGWVVTNRLTERVAEGRFMGSTSKLSQAVADHLAACETALRGGYAFIKTAKDVDRRQWRDYSATLDLRRHYQAIQGLGYAPMVTENAREAHVRSVRREGYPDYDIRPSGSRVLYGPILYLEPFDERNQRAIGYDMFSEPTRRAAMERARDTGEPTISGKVALVQETGEDFQAGFLMYFPVYSSSERLDTLAERRSTLQGFVYSPFRMNNFMEEMLGQGVTDIGVDIFDGGEPVPPALMFQSAPEHSPMSGNRQPRFTSLVRQEFFGRAWTMRFYSLPEFEAGIDRTLPLLILAGGLAVSFLLVVILLSVSDTQHKATAIADRMTADLRASEERTKLILSSTGEPIYGIGMKGECTFCNPACLRALGYCAPEELLGKNMHTLIHHTMADGSPYAVKDCPIFTAFLRGEEVHVVDEFLWRSDGSGFPVEYWSYPQISSGNVVGAVVIFQDITERKHMEEDSAKLAGLVQAANRVAIIATDTNGQVTVFNKGAEALLGYEAAEMAGTPVRRIHLEEEMEEQGKLMTQQMQRPISGFEVLVARVREGDFEARQWTYLRKDGIRVPVELVVTAVRDKRDKLIGFLGVATDMTDRVKTERALRRSKERFHKLAELSPVGIFETDAEGNCLFVNKRWQEFAGLNLKQALGRGWVDAIHPEDTAAVFSEWLEATERKREFALEYRFMTPEGKVTWVMGNAKALRDESGELQGFFGTVMDIGKRIKAEAALRESKARLSAVLETAVDPILTVGEFGHIRSANKAARETFGYSFQELEGQNVKMLMPEPYHSSHDGYLERYRSTGEPHILGLGGREVQGKRKDGLVIPMELSVSEFRSGDERIFTGILRDVSERVRARESLESANAELAARQKIVDADMEAAAEIQRSLLPKQGTCSLGIEADFRFMPSTIIGGDIFNLVCLGPEHTGLYMVDVSGHGVPAALVSVSVAQELSPSGDVLMDRLTDEPRRPDDVLRLLDTAFPLERFDKFFSMFYLVYEPRSGKLTYCNAGHPPPMLLRARGGLEFLEEGGTLVGMGLGDTYVQGAVDVGDGDTLLVYTDGVTELEDPQGGQFSMEALEALFQDSHNASPEQVLQIITGKLQAHADGRPPDDDISIVCVRFNKT